MKLFVCLTGVKETRETIKCPNNAAILIQAINQAASHFSDQLHMHEQIEEPRTSHTVQLLQQSILNPEDDEEQSVIKSQRPATPFDYTLAIDYTATKMVYSVIEKCKLFKCVSALHREECRELLTRLEDLYEILKVIQGSAYLDRYQEVLEQVQLYSTKAYAFLEKLCFKALLASIWIPHKAQLKFDDFACTFFNQRVQLCKEHERSENDFLMCVTPREERQSFGVTTYLVPSFNVARKLYKKKRVVIPLTEIEGKSAYNVEFNYPRSWRSKNVFTSAKIESNDRGYEQFLQADRVKLEKGSWGWEESQDTVMITYDDLLVANVASISGSLLTYDNHYEKDKKSYRPQTYRTSIQIVGSSRIDLDLQNLLITGMKEKDNVYYKCFVNSNGEEILAIYRYHRRQFQTAQGLLHVVGRGNQPGLRHVLVAIFACLGFTCVA